MDTWLTLGTAAALGLLHAFELDHMVAVSAFVAQQPTPRAAATFGARWGIGHSGAVLLVGGLLLASGLRLPKRFDAYGEMAVGVMLIAVGAAAFRSACQPLLARDGPGHRIHPHVPPEEAHDVGHRITAVGVMHGLAGTSGIVVLVPVTLMHDTALGLAYLVAFGIGVTLAMTCYAMVAATAIQGATSRSIALGRQLVMGVGVAGTVVGLWWVARATYG